MTQCQSLFAYHAQVPQQDNFCDCGVYVLQYMESLFQVSSDSYTQAKNTQKILKIVVNLFIKGAFANTNSTFFTFN